MAQQPHRVGARELGTQGGDLRVGEPVPLGPPQQRRRQPCASSMVDRSSTNDRI